MCRYAEPVQEPFEGVPRKQQVEWLRSLAGEVQQLARTDAPMSRGFLVS